MLPRWRSTGVTHSACRRRSGNRVFGTALPSIAGGSHEHRSSMSRYRPRALRQLSVQGDDGHCMAGCRSDREGSSPSQTGSPGALLAPASDVGKIQDVFNAHNHRLARSGKFSWPGITLSTSQSGESSPAGRWSAYPLQSPASPGIFHASASAAIAEPERLGPARTTAAGNGRTALTVCVCGHPAQRRPSTIHGPEPPAPPFVPRNTPVVSHRVVAIAPGMTEVAGCVQSADLRTRPPEC
jgi:hypothetical protein